MLTQYALEKIKSLKKDEKGSTAIMFGLMVMPMFFAIGMAIDQGRVIRVEVDLQNALDGGALAAMRSDENPETVGNKYFAANFKTPGPLPATVHFSKLEDGSVRATASVSVPALASAIMGMNTFQIETYSVVEPPHEITNTTTTDISTAAIPCLHVMDQSGSYTFDLLSNTNIDAKTCSAHIRSNSGSALRAQNSTNVKFKRLRVKGGGSIDSGAGTTHFSGSVEEDQPIVANPYMDAVRDVVQATSIGNCTNANTGTTSSPLVLTGSVSPGTYCGSVTIKNANLGAGLYVIKSGSGNTKKGRLALSGNINGSAGVSFYLADSQTQISSYAATSGSVLTAPTTGTTRGLLFFEDSNRGATWSATFSGTVENSWKGIVYLPSANLTIGSDDWDLFNVSMAVNRLYLNGVQDMHWLPYAWTPFNATGPITLEGESDISTTTTTTTDATEIYLRE